MMEWNYYFIYLFSFFSYLRRLLSLFCRQKHTTQEHSIQETSFYYSLRFFSIFIFFSFNLINRMRIYTLFYYLLYWQLIELIIFNHHYYIFFSYSLKTLLLIVQHIKTSVINKKIFHCFDVRRYIFKNMIVMFGN